MRLYLVRHGQSEGNVAKTFHGHTDYPLTELGREQARQAGEKLKDTAFVRCVASDLSRAWDTALSCVAGRGMIPERCPGLREQFVGEMEGLSWDEMERRYPGVREAYISDWFHTTPPGGESPEEMARWDRIAAVRTAVNGALEQARADKTIGKSLEAEVDLTVPAEDAFLGQMEEGALADLLIVSQVRVETGDSLSVTVRPAAGTKCQRCWKMLTSVGTVAGHEDLCPRCAAVVKSLPVVE